MSKGDELSLASQEISFLDNVGAVLPGRRIYDGAHLIKKIARYGVLKRGVDLVIATVFLVLLSPLFLIVAVIIKIDSPGPVFFKQIRTGKNGKEFHIYKFRSMAADNDVRDTSCEDKYTKFGKILRRTSIDELPQLINIVKGEMAFIGPRPWVTEYWENMNEYERGRAMVRPGITGLAAAKGRNGLTVFEKIDYDLDYVRNYSFRQDAKVVFLTFSTVVSGKGASSNKAVIHDELEELKTRKMIRE